MSEHDFTDDAELVRRYVLGVAGAFDEIVTRYERRVYAVALRMVGEPEAARDVTQEVFISALRALRSFRAEARLSTWFHRVAVNASLDHLRKRKRRGASPLDDAVEIPDPDVGPEARAIASSRAAEVQRALRTLSDEHRAVVVLHDLEGHDYAAIAGILDVPIGTVKSRLHRARVELARRLGHLRSADAEQEPSRKPLRGGS